MMDGVRSCEPVSYGPWRKVSIYT